MAAARTVKLSDADFQAISRALADPRRFAMLEQIAGCSAGSLQCSALTEHEAISPATVSHHLKELQEAGLVDVVREGRTAQLSLRRPVWQAYLERLSRL